ncbi:MAG: hypothetical protein LR015_04085 [Verrucomicrobia bacterium]|nr:hypothetical protein [Verrucomicrobiota bacterium]
MVADSAVTGCYRRIALQYRLRKKSCRWSFFAIPYRMFFIFAIDVTKMLATIEEIFKVKMSWGTIERRGTIALKPKQ